MRVSFHIKCILVFGAVLLLSQGRIRYYRSDFQPQKAEKAGKFIDKLYAQDQDENSRISGKRKSKGLKLAQAEISTGIVAPFVFVDRSIEVPETGPALFCWCSANGKRGPPGADARMPVL